MWECALKWRLSFCFSWKSQRHWTSIWGLPILWWLQKRESLQVTSSSDNHVFYTRIKNICSSETYIILYLLSYLCFLIEVKESKLDEGTKHQTRFQGILTLYHKQNLNLYDSIFNLQLKTNRQQEQKPKPVKTMRKSLWLWLRRFSFKDFCTFKEQGRQAIIKKKPYV